LTADAVRSVEISNLSLGPVLGSGGQGRVIAVKNHLIDGKWPAALKTYSTGVNLDARGLEKIVAFPDQLHRNNRDWLMGISSWPWAIAMDNGAICGFLMRVVPEIYHFNFMTVTQGSKAKLSTVEFLLNPDDYIKRSGILISEKDRLNLLGTLAESMSRLHSLGIVIGDVSPKNLLFNLNSYASCFIIDCDAVALHGRSALNQVDTPGWEVPPGEEKGTEASDSYKFGLLAIRLFARDQDSQDASAISAFSPELGRLAALSQDDNALSRPAPGSWVSAIQSAASSASSGYAGQVPTASQAFTATQPVGASSQAPQYGGQNLSQPPHGPAAGMRPYPAPSPRSRSRGGKILGLAGAALVALVAIIIGVSAAHNNTASNVSQAGNSAGSSGGSVSSAPSSQAASSAPPTSVGNVNISDSVSADSAAAAVAGIFNTYFTGINNRDYQQALSVFDPNGVINPNDSSQVQQFANGVSTTSDSGMTLVNITPSDGSPVQSAEVQFTSHQQAGYGPQDDPNGTCTNWDVTYTLSQGSSGNYLISNVSDSTDSAC
jgi:serine/threonine protein kinase